MIIMWTNLYWLWDLTIQYGTDADLHSRVLREVKLINAKEAPEVVSHEEALALKDQDDTFMAIDKMIKDLSE